MFGELPKLLDKNFAIAYYIPASIFFAAEAWLLYQFQLLNPVLEWMKVDLLWGTTVIGLIIWVFSILLAGLNRSIIRFYEGYGDWNLLRIFGRSEKRIFKKLNQEVETLKDAEPVDEVKLAKKMQKQVQRFPDKEEFLLPTALGNTIRAFEVYSRVMYGIEGIQGWTRLLSVISQEYLGFVESAKAQLIFWINLKTLAWLFFISLIFTANSVKILYLGLGLLAVEAIIAFCTYNAQLAAVEWGESVKAAFDTHLPELAEKMGISTGISRGQERKVWTEFSQAVIYHIPTVMPLKKRPSKKD